MVAFWGLIITDVLIFAPVGAWLASQKGRSPAEGAIVGGVLGILGVLVIGLAPSAQGATRMCPQCAEKIQAAAKVCRYCGTAVEPIPVVPARMLSPLSLVLLIAIGVALVWIAMNGSILG